MRSASSVDFPSVISLIFCLSPYPSSTTPAYFNNTHNMKRNIDPADLSDAATVLIIISAHHPLPSIPPSALLTVQLAASILS